MATSYYFAMEMGAWQKLIGTVRPRLPAGTKFHGTPEDAIHAAWINFATQS